MPSIAGSIDFVGLTVLEHSVLVDSASCAKALAPTTALFLCTGIPVALCNEPGEPCNCRRLKPRFALIVVAARAQ